MADPEQMRAAVATYFRTIRDGDAEAFLALFAEDAVSHDPLGAPPHRGRDGLAALFERTQDFWDVLDIDPGEVFVAGTGAATRWQATGRCGDAVVEFAGIDVFDFDAAGHVTALRAYWDIKDVLSRALG